MKFPAVVLGFRPPLAGFEGDFNTFRLGRTWAKRIAECGPVALLVDERIKCAFGRAEILGYDVGQMKDMLAKHARQNHTQLARRSDHATDLYQIMVELYGPHIVTPEKIVTVIHLRRLP